MMPIAGDTAIRRPRDACDYACFDLLRTAPASIKYAETQLCRRHRELAADADVAKKPASHHQENAAK